MKSTLFLLSAMLGMGICPPALAAQKATSYEQATRLVKEDGYVVFIYADGWDRFSKPLMQKLLKSSHLDKASNTAVFLELPRPEVLNDETKGAYEAICGKLEVGDPVSYPALMLLTPAGRCYGSIYGPELIKGSEQEIAKLLTAHIAEMRKGEALLKKAEAATGLDKARLLGEAATLPLFSRPAKILDQIKAADPQDETGYVECVSYNQQGFSNSWKGKPIEEISAAVDKIQANKYLTIEQKQSSFCILLGELRRQGGPANMKLMKQRAEQMKALDPDSVFAGTADFVLANWYAEFTYEKGWSPSVFMEDGTPVELEGKLPIKEAGTYKVNFQWTHGGHAATITSVKLYDGATLVAEDNHEGSTGHRNKANDYTLTVDKALKSPRMTISFKMGNKRDSYGKILITPTP